jgi:hypothetical protein
MSLSAVVAAWQAGALTGEQMQDVLRRGEVLPIAATGEGERVQSVSGKCVVRADEASSFSKGVPMANGYVRA